MNLQEWDSNKNLWMTSEWQILPYLISPYICIHLPCSTFVVWFPGPKSRCCSPGGPAPSVAAYASGRSRRCEPSTKDLPGAEAMARWLRWLGNIPCCWWNGNRMLLQNGLVTTTPMSPEKTLFHVVVSYVRTKKTISHLSLAEIAF